MLIVACGYRIKVLGRDCVVERNNDVSLRLLLKGIEVHVERAANNHLYWRPL